MRRGRLATRGRGGVARTVAAFRRRGPRSILALPPHVAIAATPGGRRAQRDLRPQAPDRLSSYMQQPDAARPSDAGGHHVPHQVSGRPSRGSARRGCIYQARWEGTARHPAARRGPGLTRVASTKPAGRALQDSGALMIRGFWGRCIYQARWEGTARLIRHRLRYAGRGLHLPSPLGGHCKNRTKPPR